MSDVTYRARGHREGAGRGGHSGPVAARPWSEAWQEALYGPDGFFQRSLPLEHYRTSVANPLFARAVRVLAGRVDDALGRPDPFDVVDLGAGGGELLQALPDVPGRWRLTGVDLRPGPAGLRWAGEVPALTGLLLANEWLDAVPLDVVEDGRLVLVAADGTEQPGAPVTTPWADRWWPQAPGPGRRVELGAPRDRAWAAAVARVHRGLAVAVDYAQPPVRQATLTGYRGGRQVAAVPDGSCDLTAHVTVESCAATTGARVLRQADALRALGVTARLPAPGSPSYARLLQEASQARELLAPDGLGAFVWLVQDVGLPAGSMVW